MPFISKGATLAASVGLTAVLAVAIWFYYGKGNPASMNAPDYKSYVISTYEELTRNLNYDAMRKRLNDPRRLAFFAAMAADMHKLTGNAKYAEQAEKTFRVLMDEWRRNPELYRKHDNPFFVAEPLLHAYAYLQSAGKLEDGDEELLRAYLPYANARQMTDNNQGLSRAVGAAEALRLFPDHPDAAKWKANIDELWNYWYANKDLNENAGHYNAIGLSAVIRLAELTGRTQQLQNGEARSMFERYRDQLSPSGAVPEYGDDYFGSEWQAWIYVFEAAARMYDDSSFLEAAWKTFAFHSKNYPLRYAPGSFDDNLWSVVILYPLAEVLSLPETSLGASGAEAGSLVTRRNEPGRPGTPDKLILGADRAPGTPYVMSELYGRGYHSHTNRIGALLYYEAGGIPLFHGLTRHNRSATDANIVALLPPDEPYPAAVSAPEPGVWQHESIPVRGLIAGSMLDQESFTLDAITLRLAANKPYTFAIDHLRLEGPAGVKVIDDFETLAQWERADRPYSLGTNAVEGNHALHVRVKPGASLFYRNKGYRTTFSLQDYTTIKYDWTYIAAERTDIDFIFRVTVNPTDSVPVDVDFYPSDTNLVPLLKQAEAESRRKDSYGLIRLDEYYTFDSKLTRQMVLTEEGALILVDELLPGPLASGYTAGPLWNLYSLEAQGPNWFDSPGEARSWYKPDGTEASAAPSLLVYYAPGEGRTFGAVNVPMNGGMKPYTTFARQTVASGSKVRFVTLLIPHGSGETAAEIAASIRVDDRPEETLAEFTRSGRTVRVSIGGSGMWSVERVQ
ncbi:hypothetical protein N0M98_31910 [Paenibacillus doosanensis]|uniref:Uncharacterized protein n=2 Tax=Paenibacillus konkukensis TaxID=2020716 RepID=A0ABY4RVL4_9BACL|nr:hypothetical protein [Paenibacillus doosanensis]MCS7464705.1 hypothetical protein [Paenibacillus doosanensis]UQZ85855.1 hypothetical protein SK3146_05145 [Paenibacillus konkukensis]